MNSIQIEEKSTSHSVSAKISRLFFLDHLRAALVILVVLHHVAMVYGASAPFYYVEPPFTDPQAYTILLVFALGNQGWFMGALFLIAGYFTPGSFDRKGSTSYLRGRLVRLGIPLIIFYFILGPIASMGFWRDGNHELLQQLKPLIVDKSDIRGADWEAMVALMRKNLVREILRVRTGMN